MATDRACISGYFEKEEEKAIQKYANKHRLTKSKALEALVKKAFSDDSESPEELIFNQASDRRITELERDRDFAFTVRTGMCSSIDKLEEQVAYLQDNVERLQRLVERTQVEYFTDDQVASHVGARVETVKEWRLGLRKPRGSNICSLIEDFQLDYGRWRMRG
ncbi:MAG: hypothetical protein QNJ53_03960 [Pleurocapsa sp. MO_192.B19]|nr:hypothetical protein [Pleurocapsa sp. MO_192.B19]